MGDLVGSLLRMAVRPPWGESELLFRVPEHRLPWFYFV